MSHIVIAYLITQMTLVWLLYRLLKNPSIVDLSWGVGLTIAGLIYLAAAKQTPHTILTETLLILWGLRLSGYMFYTRARHNKIDNRYTALSNNWKIAKPLGFFINFQLQGLFIFILTSIFYFVYRSPIHSITTLDICASILILISLLGETIADQTLHHFKQTQQGKVCDVGLWQYSRHPNYFFEWMIWCGFSLIGLQHHLGWIGLISPILLYVIFNFMTGPITERCSVASRGQAYKDYQQTTSFFFPWFKTKLIDKSQPN